MIDFTSDHIAQAVAHVTADAGGLKVVVTSGTDERALVELRIPFKDLMSYANTASNGVWQELMGALAREANLLIACEKAGIVPKPTP